MRRPRDDKSSMCDVLVHRNIIHCESTLRKPLAKRNNVIGVGRRRKLGFMRGVERCGRSAGAIQGDTEVALG